MLDLDPRSSLAESDFRRTGRQGEGWGRIGQELTGIDRIAAVSAKYVNNEEGRPPPLPSLPSLPVPALTKFTTPSQDSHRMIIIIIVIIIFALPSAYLLPALSLENYGVTRTACQACADAGRGALL